MKEQLACNTDFLHSVVFTSSVAGAVIRGGGGGRSASLELQAIPGFHGLISSQLVQSLSFINILREDCGCAPCSKPLRELGMSAPHPPIAPVCS